MTITQINHGLLAKLHPIWAFAVGVCPLGFTFDFNTYVAATIIARYMHFVTITITDENFGVVQ